MERKNMILLTVIGAATLLVAMVGATFAFFTATVQDTRSQDGGDDGTANITAGSVANTTVVGNVENAAGKFTATGVYPGHREVAGLSVAVTNGAEQVTSNTNVNIVYDVDTNGFKSDEIEVTVFRSEEELSLNNYFNCTHSVTSAEDGQHFSETCDHEIDEIESLDDNVTKLTKSAVTLTGGKEKKILVNDTISATGQVEKKVFYYVAIEFKDTGKSQNDSMNATLNGTIKVEAA